ncbi:MAG TPA: class I SAM-dependent methyltransferase, partial [Thermoanaerobaculia bacterium]
RYYDAILPFYDESLADRGDLPFWEAMATRWGATRILELGCGTGRVTEVLSRHAAVIGVDLLIEMLRHAVKRAPRARLVASDLRQFAFAAKFDLIVLADDPMAHLTSIEDRARVIRLIADHLTPDGRVVLEGLYRREGKRDIRPGTVEESWTPAGAPSVWRASYRYQTAVVSSQMRSWSRQELAHLSDAGLQVESVWGDFSEGLFHDDSERIIVVGHR